MRFAPQMAEIRFGCGLSPVVTPPTSVHDMLATLQSPDTIAAQFPIETFETFQTRIAEGRRLGKLRRETRGSPEALAAKKARRVLNQEARIEQVIWLGQHLNRWT